MAVPFAAHPDGLPVQDENEKNISPPPPPVAQISPELTLDRPPELLSAISNGVIQLDAKDANSGEISSQRHNSSTEDAPLVPMPASPSAPSTEPPNETQKAKEGEKPEDVSLSPTLLGSRTNDPGPADTTLKVEVVSPSFSNGSGKPKESSSPKSPKPSFLSKLMHILVPCAAPSSRSHPIEINDSISTKSEVPPTITEKSGAAHAEPAVADSELSNATPAPALLVSESLGGTTSNPVPVAVATPPLPMDTEVILPPTAHLLPKSETEGVTSGSVQPPGSTGGSLLQDKVHSRDSTVPSNVSVDGEDSEGTSFTEDEDLDDVNGSDEVEDDEDKLILNGGAGIPIGPDGIPKPLLPPIAPQHVGRKCLILDLDETLVHSSFKSIQQADYVVPVEIEYHWHNVYVIKRPGVDNFLKKMGEIYEVVVFTASLSKYADPVLDKLDMHQVVSHRLFRESCYNHKGNYVKDLSQLGRPIADTIILDNSPASYIFHPNNAVPVSSWFNDPHDTELTDLIPFLADLAVVDDVRGVLDGAR